MRTYHVTTEVLLKDASRPYAVVAAAYRGFRLVTPAKVVGRYETEAQAMRRSAVLNCASAQEEARRKDAVRDYPDEVLE